MAWSSPKETESALDALFSPDGPVFMEPDGPLVSILKEEDVACKVPPPMAWHVRLVYAPDPCYSRVTVSSGAWHWRRYPTAPNPRRQTRRSGREFECESPMAVVYTRLRQHPGRRRGRRGLIAAMDI